MIISSGLPKLDFGEIAAKVQRLNYTPIGIYSQYERASAGMDASAFGAWMAPASPALAPFPLNRFGF